MKIRLQDTIGAFQGAEGCEIQYLISATRVKTGPRAASDKRPSVFCQEKHRFPGFDRIRFGSYGFEYDGFVRYNLDRGINSIPNRYGQRIVSDLSIDIEFREGQGTLILDKFAYKITRLFQIQSAHVQHQMVEFRLIIIFFTKFPV